LELGGKVAPNEQLVAWGSYKYQVSGKNSGLTESWSLHSLPDMGFIHRAQVKGVIAALHLRQESYFIATPDYYPNRLEMTQQIEDDLTRSIIQCYPGSIEQIISRGTETNQKIIETPTGYGLFFPPVSAQGFIVRRYDLERGGRQALPLVSVRIQPAGDLPLSVELQTIEFEHINSHEEIETPAGQFTCHHFIRYDQHMEQHLWLDQTWLPIQWSVPYSPIMKWEYLLTRYYREK
jgi:hypothetical protein